MHIHYLHYLLRKHLRVALLSTLSIVGAFSLGIQTAGDVQPITLIEAGSMERVGDMDGSGSVDLRDVTLILEIAEGYRTAGNRELRADPNGDGLITVDDALRILATLALQ